MSDLILYDDLLIESEIFSKKFSCDLKKCKGACCTFYGEYGAPVLDSEVKIIEEIYPIVKKYLSQNSINYIENHGMIEGTPGNYTTVCIENKDCVFVYWENGIALCAIEKAYLNKEIEFRKPLSCHLFPIREAHWNRKKLYFQQIDECKPALKKGIKENIYLYESVKEALIRRFGKTWYENFENYIKLDNK